jgi:hypothetical protein
MIYGDHGAAILPAAAALRKSIAIMQGKFHNFDPADNCWNEVLTYDDRDLKSIVQTFLYKSCMQPMTSTYLDYRPPLNDAQKQFLSQMNTNFFFQEIDIWKSLLLKDN